jgi:DNA-binding NarL/FixJ family response regulator
VSRTTALEGLTPREREVLLKSTAAKSNKQIARELKIKEKIVKAHLDGIFIKLGVQSRMEAIARIDNQGILGSRYPSRKSAIDEWYKKK